MDTLVFRDDSDMFKGGSTLALDALIPIDDLSLSYHQEL